MQVQYKLKLGQDEFTLTADVQNEMEFFQKMAFYSGLPKTGPNGETDLKLVHRTTKKGDYYSLVSETAGQEFRLGILREGGLFPKGWAPIYRGDSDSAETASTNVASVGQTGGITGAKVTVTAETTKPAQTTNTAAKPATAAPAVSRSAMDIVNQYATNKTSNVPGVSTEAASTASSLLRR